MSADRDSRALPQILLQSWRAGRLQVEALRYWLPPGWTIATTPHVNLTNEEWLELCNAAGFVSGIGLSMFLEHGFRGGPVAHRLVAAPPHRLTLYRGAPYKYRAGWSWTPDAHTAMRFAAAPKAMNTMHGRGMLWLSVVPAGSILMHIANPSFDEYVVNTAGLDIWPARHVPNWDGP
ncbi:MAG: hypothetical protein EKK34_18105 [Mycobacterium sp.]|nr:MAG: hypothetical protein EKK34_18105 [Mycobacterium sp.]